MIRFSILLIVMLVSAQVQASVQADAALGEPVEILAAGKYESEQEKPLLKGIELSSWADETWIKSDISYLQNGTTTWSKLQAQVVHEGGNRFRAKARYYARGNYGGCYVPILLEFRSYEKGFLMKRYQPTLIDLDYCRFYSYQWVPDPRPYLLQ